jgi:exonuclease SbcC
MKLTRLELRNWCQHESLDIDFPQDRIVRLYGHNNAGKTNIIRAIGRVLAQGRTDFERVSGLRYGAKSGSIRLSAVTHEGMPFAIGRTIGKGGHATLEFENTTLTKAEEIEQQLEAWFGPKETLLQLFIARQGKISSLLVEKGRDRLRKFIEICGFKGLLEKQSALNKFMKSYPSLDDQSNLLGELQSKQEEARLFQTEKQQALAALPPLKESEATIAQLEQRRTLRVDTQTQFQLKRPQLEQKQRCVQNPVVDLAPLNQRIASLGVELNQTRSCASYQSHARLAAELREQLQNAKAALAAIPEDTTDFANAVRNISRNLQEVNLRQKTLAQEGHAYTQALKDLRAGEARQTEKARTLSRVSYSLQWQEIPLNEINGLQELLIQRRNLSNETASAQNRLQTLEAVPAPSDEVLRASNINRAQLTGLQELHRHAQSAVDGLCPLCQREWNQALQQQASEDFETRIRETEAALNQAGAATRALQQWTRAQAELPAAKQRAGTLAEQHLQMNQAVETWRRDHDVPERDLAKVPEITHAYRSVAEAQQPVDLDGLRVAFESEAGKKTDREQEEAELATTMGRLNNELVALLQKQNAAGLEAQKRARLLQAKETLEARLSPAEKGMPAAIPVNFEVETDYSHLVAQQEMELDLARKAFERASSAWTERDQSQREIEALQREIQAAEARLADLAWGDEEEAKLAEAGQQKEQYRRLEAEIALIRGQHNERAAQIGSVQKMQKRFLVQASHVANMGAVSDFLSYDNGPQKFLTGIFQEALNQTNVLLSEMGLPVKLHMGDELEVLVQDRNSPESPASELGGGYANLIGIAFRIALQKTILPRVHVIVLDEPSTHVDQGNMELLIPFFDRLKENLSSYGIDQLILIDHHPDWSQSHVGLIPVGNRTEICMGSA